MMGTPFNYEYLFDDPCDVEFHDCMWSGMCTCCMQFISQATYLEELSLVTKGTINNNNNVHSTSNQNSSSSLNSTSTHCSNSTIQNHHHNNNHHHYQTQHHHLHHHHITSSEVPTAQNGATKLTVEHQNSPHQLQHLQHNIKHHQQINISPQLIDEQLKQLASRNIEDESNINEETKLKDLSGVISPSTTSSSSPKPIRRREHNDSERKRRDHLRNAFNFLRDQVPRFKALNKKPPRIQILHEATLYVEKIKNESKELERRLNEERMKNQSLLTK